MLSHALKLVWYRRRASGLVIVEIAAAFVAVFVLIALSVHLWRNYQHPLGFDYENVWRVEIRQGTGPGAGTGESGGIRSDVLAALRALPSVTAAHEIDPTPFLRLQIGMPYGADPDNAFETRLSLMSTGAPEALGLRLVEGRWFGTEDAGQTYRAALVNRMFVEQAFGAGVDPLGRQINHPPPWMLELDDPPVDALREVRIVGLVDDYRPYGRLSDLEPYVIEQHDDQSQSDLFVKVAPDTTAGFEERIIETIQAVAPGSVVTVTPWDRLRELDQAERIAPIRAGAIVGAFFLLMVALGLTGVLWQDVVRRTQEIGLRRAIGAMSGHVRRQIVLEMSIVGLFGVALGAAVAIQFPLLRLVEQINWSSAVPALALGCALVLTLVVLSAAYPAWLASRREPADALRYE